MQIFLGEVLEDGLGRLGAAEARHCVRVLRHEQGDFIYVIDGEGKMFKGKITQIHKEEVLWAIEDETKDWGEKRPFIRLGISPLRLKDRFEWAMEKAVELGVNEIFPLRCQRTDYYKSKFKPARIETILLTALKQSKRSRLPVLHPEQPIDHFLTSKYDGAAFIAYCEADTMLQEYTPEISKANVLTLLIGPEGDFTENEIALATKTDYKTVSLGLNRLRTETAAIYGLSAFKAICEY